MPTNSLDEPRFEFGAQPYVSEDGHSPLCESLWFLVSFVVKADIQLLPTNVVPRCA